MSIYGDFVLVGEEIFFFFFPKLNWTFQMPHKMSISRRDTKEHVCLVHGSSIEPDEKQ